jgi:hypothetical protein
MPRTCTICHHPDRQAIDRALLSGLPFRHIAAQWEVSTGALQRHKEADLPALLVKAEEAVEALRAEDLLGELRALHLRTLRLLDQAEQTKQLGVAMTAIREARGNLELLAKLVGQLDTRPTLNLLIAPEWLSLRAVLLRALAPYPDARATVASQLAQLEAS